MPIVEVNGKEFHMDGYIQSVADISKEMLRKDWDVVLLCDGVEGSGKSVLAQQLGGYIAKPLNDEEQISDYFTLDDICFTAPEFKKKCENQKKFRTVIFDEAFRGLSARRAMSNVNNALNTIFNEVRQRNLCIIIVMPSFFEMDKYPALWRSVALFHVKTDARGNRGFVNVYDRDRKTILYLEGKKKYSYSKPMPNYRCRFTKTYTVDELEYKKKKAKAFLGANTEEFQSKKVLRFRKYLQSILTFCIENGHKYNDISIATGIKPATLSSLKNRPIAQQNDTHMQSDEEDNN